MFELSTQRQNIHPIKSQLTAHAFSSILHNSLEVRVSQLVIELHLKVISSQDKYSCPLKASEAWWSISEQTAS